MKTVFQKLKKRPQQLIRSIGRHGGNDEEGEKYQQEDNGKSKELLLVVALLMEDGEQQEVNDLVGRGYANGSARKKRRLTTQ